MEGTVEDKGLREMIVYVVTVIWHIYLIWLDRHLMESILAKDIYPELMMKGTISDEFSFPSSSRQTQSSPS